MAIALRALPYLLAVTVVFAIAACGWRLGVNQTDATWQARTNAALAEAMQQAAQAQGKAREAEQASAQAMHSIDNAYQQGRTDAQTQYDRTIADRDSGAISLRERFTCPTLASGLPNTSTTTSKRDAGTTRGLQRTDEQFFIREAKRADEVTRQLQAAQQVIVSMQATCSARSVPSDAP